MAQNKEEHKKPGRPHKAVSPVEPVNEQGSSQLQMSQSNPTNLAKEVTMEEVSQKWLHLYSSLADKGYYTGDSANYGGVSLDTWNQLNPFLQNQRIKMLNKLPLSSSKQDLANALKSPQDYEPQLQGAGWYLSSSQQLYANILYRARDIPLYKYYVIPAYEDDAATYNKDSYIGEYKLANKWLSVFDVPTSLKTIALDVKRNGKVAYMLRSKFSTDHKGVDYAALEKMPADWIKISGIGQLGYTISFNMMYFMNPANSPALFGDFIVKAWQDMFDKGLISLDEKTKIFTFNKSRAMGYTFSYDGQRYSSMLESHFDLKKDSYMFWLKMPYDLCFTFGSDNSHSWCTPDTIGMLLGLQELSDYSVLAGLIQSTPLTAVMTGEAEYADSAQAGKTMTKISPEVLTSLQTIFNSMTSTNIKAFFAPLKNIELQQLKSDVNSSEITKNATQNFITQSGEGGLTITTDKPNVSQVHGAQLAAAEKERYVTLQFQRVINFVFAKKLGFKYDWQVRLWGDCYGFKDEKGYEKELFAAGGKFILPKLLSAEDMNLLDAKATEGVIDAWKIYEHLATPTQVTQAELSSEASDIQADNADKAAENDGSQPTAGRPKISADDVENEATAASQDAGTNTVDNRDK